jgi:hypothetical protein
MNILKRRFPKCVDVDNKNKTIHCFETMEEFLEIDWIKSKVNEQDFYRFSVSGNNLMLELKEGREWWVIGIFETRDSLELPKLVCPKDL